jgi:hypothetical protein
LPELGEIAFRDKKGLVRKQNLADRGGLTNRSGIVWVQVARVVEILDQRLGKFPLPHTHL